MQEGEWFDDGLVSTTLAIVGVRDRFGRWLVEQDVDAEAAADLTVVVSELCANAVFASGSAEDHISVRAWLEGATVVLEVEGSQDPGSVGVVFHDDGDPLRGHGQGLLIVTAYTDSVEVVPPRGAAGLVVRCRKQTVLSPAHAEGTS